MSTLHPCALSAPEARLVRRALRVLESRALRTAPVLYYFDDFQRYLQLRFAGLTNEQLHVLYLNLDRRLLATEVEGYGNQKQVHSDLRAIALRAIQLGAEFIVMAHNHPTDNARPSENDVRHLEWVECALTPLGLQLLDSFVVTSEGITSIRTYRNVLDEAQQRENQRDWDDRAAARRAKLAATRAAKAARQSGDNA